MRRFISATLVVAALFAAVSASAQRPRPKPAPGFAAQVVWAAA